MNRRVAVKKRKKGGSGNKQGSNERKEKLRTNETEAQEKRKGDRQGE